MQMDYHEDKVFADFQSVVNNGPKNEIIKV